MPSSEAPSKAHLILTKGILAQKSTGFKLFDDKDLDTILETKVVMEAKTKAEISILVVEAAVVIKAACQSNESEDTKLRLVRSKDINNTTCKVAPLSEILKMKYCLVYVLDKTNIRLVESFT